MIYTDVLFIGLLALVWLATEALRPWRSAREWAIIIFSLFVIATWGLFWLVLLLAVALTNFAIVRLAISLEQRQRSLLLGVAVALDLAALATFKYAGFFETTLDTLFHVKLPVLMLGLPLAISFYTFLRRDLPLPCTISLSASFSEAGASQAYSLVDKLLKEPDPREPRWAFFPIAGADLFTYDGGHLTGASQQTASQRLGAALVDAGIVEGLKGSPR